MSTIDQAFVKAYAHTPTGKPPSPEAMPGAEPPSPPNVEVVLSAVSQENPPVAKNLSPTSGRKVRRKSSSAPAAAGLPEKKPAQPVVRRAPKKTSKKASPPKKSREKKPLRQPARSEIGRPATGATYRLDPPQPNLPTPQRAPRKRSKSTASTAEAPHPDRKPAAANSAGGSVPRRHGKIPEPSARPKAVQLATCTLKAPLPAEAPALDFVPSAPHGFWSGLNPQEFRPALQVERLAWPRDAGRLESAAQAELDRLADSLENARAQGQSLLGFVALRPGEGATTLMIAVARRLAERGRRLLLADADAAAPQLARRLGILPQIGWEEVLLGRQTLAEVAVESIQEPVVVLPLRNPIPREVWNAEGKSRWAETCLTIRRHFDFGLIDGGSWEQSPWADPRQNGRPPEGLDAVLLVRRPQKTALEELLPVQKQFLLAGTPVLGVVENFVS